MTCATCNAPVKTVDSQGGTKTGDFVEKYECANGHTGQITGDNEDPPKSWNRSGAVFVEYPDV